MCVRFYGILYHLCGSLARMFVCVESPYLIYATSSFLKRALIFLQYKIEVTENREWAITNNSISWFDS